LIGVVSRPTSLGREKWEMAPIVLERAPIKEDEREKSREQPKIIDSFLVTPVGRELEAAAANSSGTTVCLAHGLIRRPAVVCARPASACTAKADLEVAGL
jgi:hypothetical protein